MNIKPSILRWVNILAFILTIVVNSLVGSTTLIGGKTTAEISDANPTLITPAGYVFSIWGIIYILLGLFVIYQAIPSQQEKDFQRRIGILFAISSLLNITWLFLWQYEVLTFSVVLMFMLLVTLISIYLRLGIGKVNVSLRERIAVHLPFSVYLGWITVASIANVAVTLVSLKWGGLGIDPEIWAVVVIVVAVVITILMLVTRRDFAYSLVIIWALIGIGANQGGNEAITFITQISTIVIAITIITVIIIGKIIKK